MKKLLTLIISLFIITGLVLAGCADVDNTTVTQTTTLSTTIYQTTTITTYIDEKYIWEQLKQNQEGTINVQDADYYYRQVDEDDEEVDFHGVTFIIDYASYLISQGDIVIAPYTYYSLAEFEDGTSEALIHVGFLFEQEIVIGISDHDNPRAGIIQIHDKKTNETTMYLLVSLAG